MSVIVDGEEYLRLEDVLKITGLKQANLYIKIRCKEFPKPEHKKIRAIWKKSDVEKYLESKEK